VVLKGSAHPAIGQEGAPIEFTNWNANESIGQEAVAKHLQVQGRNLGGLHFLIEHRVALNLFGLLHHQETSGMRNANPTNETRPTETAAGSKRRGYITAGRLALCLFFCQSGCPRICCDLVAQGATVAYRIAWILKGLAEGQPSVRYPMDCRNHETVTRQVDLVNSGGCGRGTP
jgi:hypothetical protein